MIFVITGTSGCGKTSLVRLVLGNLKDVQFAVSHTTREMRSSEEEGRDYYFVSDSEFKQIIKEEKFVEWATVHGNYYGTSRREMEKKGALGDLLLDIDVQGAQQVKSRIKKAVFIFILPPSFQELQRRIKGRGQDDAGSIQTRLDVACKEIRAYPGFDYIIINDQLDKAAKELESIIISTRCKLEYCKKEIAAVVRSFSEDE
ncbi:MAG: guanylate kinase [Candidatus Aminicenantes bacterium]|jgi:guanylate kinase|nr:guanylate kinase [Candidatus Aminicenantes bacterium]